MIDVLDFGAVEGGYTDCTTAFQCALDSLRETGGELRVPAGVYTVGSLRLYSHTTLYLEAGARLCASGEYTRYPVITEEMVPGFVRGTRQGVLFALDAEGITVCGEGTIDGCGQNWWQKGETDEQRPRTIQFINVDGVKIEGIHICNSPCWTVHPIHCSNVNIHGITIKNPYDSPNTDGINPESCKNVHISDCLVDVGDDCITIKSGMERDLFQKQFPCENITVTNCTFVHGHGGIVIGSEMSGGVRNVTVSNCIFQNTDRGIRIKTRRKRGGVVEDILINNVLMDNVVAGITMNEYYKCGASPDDTELFSYEPKPLEASTPHIHNIKISNIIMKNVRAAGVYILGLPERPIDGIEISQADIRVVGNTEGEDSIAVFNITPSYGDGICMRNVNNCKIIGCTLTAKAQDYIWENVKNSYINENKI